MTTGTSSRVGTASVHAKLRNGWRARLGTWQLYLMLLPTLVYLILFAYKPMYGVLIAFKDFTLKQGVFDSPWVGFYNFQRLFKSYWFPIILKNTLTLSLLSLVIGFPIPVIVALMLNEVQHKQLKNTIQTVSYAPHFISTVVVCGMITLFLSPSTGIINRLLNVVGVDSIYFMRDPGYFKWVYVISDVWQNTGWGTIIYTAALSGVDKSLLEASDIDGATRLQKIFYINFPVLVPTIIVLFILQCGNLLSVGYEKVYLLQTPTNQSASEVISTYVYKVGLEDHEFSFSTAANLFNSIVNSVILIGVNTVSNKINKSGLW